MKIYPTNRRRFAVLCLLLLGAIIAGFQTHTFPALDTNNAFTGINTFTNLNQTLYLSTTSGVDYGTQINTLQAATGVAIGIPCTGAPLNFSVPIVINTPIRLFGSVIGAASNATTTANEPCTLKWTGTGSADALTVTIPAGGNLHGVELSHFTLIGNKASQTAGNGIILKGGSNVTQLDHITLDHVDVRDFKTDNIAIADNTFIVDLFDCMAFGAGQQDLHVYQTATLGVPSQLRVHGGWYLNAATDGIRIESGYAGSAEFFGVTASGNTNNGATFNTGSIKWIGGDVESNTQIGLFLGGSLSTIDSPNCFGNGNCIWLANGANQNHLIGINHDSVAADDIHIAAGALDTTIETPLSSVIIVDLAYSTNRTSIHNTNPLQSAWPFTTAGPLRFLENPVSSLGRHTGADFCYGDSTAHNIQCSFNNDAYSPIVRNSDLAAPPAIGGTTPAAITGTTITGNTSVSGALFKSTVECFSNSAPNTCNAKPTGMIVQAAATTSTVVNTTAVLATSSIFLQEDASIGGALGVTCNVTPTVQPLTVTARTNSTSFTFSASSPTTNPRCLHYWIIN